MLCLLEIDFPNIDPVIVQIWGAFALRWYGLGYLLAFAVAYVVLGRLQRKGYFRVGADDVSALLMYAIVGVFVGGRLGYLLFYSSYFSSGEFLRNPLHLIGFGQGDPGGVSGLSFHGGLVGVAIGGLLFAWTRARRQWRALPDTVRAVEGPRAPRRRTWALFLDAFDASALCAGFGIFFVRCANFINGELYGRIITDAAGAPVTDATKAPAWAMRFPTSAEGQHALVTYYREHPKAIDREGVLRLPVDADVWQTVKHQVSLRHPSQLYQGLCEGLLVVGLCWLVRRRAERRGVVAATFLIGYGVARIAMENFRQPDAQFGTGQELASWGAVLDMLGLTQGQVLCLAMILAGAMIYIAVVTSRNPFLPRSREERKLAGVGLTPQQAGMPIVTTPRKQAP